MSGFKRTADVPPVARLFAGTISKADLLEAAWHLAGLASESYGNDGAHLARLVEEIQAIRANTGRKPLKVAHLKSCRQAAVLRVANVSLTVESHQRCPACSLEMHVVAKEIA